MAEALDILEPPQRTPEEERTERKQKLAGALRIFGRFGFDEGVAGHFTVRDPERTDHFWVNPFGRSFKQMRVSDLVLVNHDGEIVEGEGLLNQAAFAIHSRIHAALPNVNAAAHTHSTFGRAFSALGKHLDPISQDSCAFFEDHVLFDDYTGVVLDTSEGDRIAAALDRGDGTHHKAAILQNHGLLTAGATVDEVAWWYITMERTCQVQLMADAAGETVKIKDEVARLTHSQVGSQLAGIFSFKPLWDVLCEESPGFLE